MADDTEKHVLHGVVVDGSTCDCQACTLSRQIFAPFDKMVQESMRLCDPAELKAANLPDSKEFALVMILEHAVGELFALGCSPVFIANICATAHQMFQHWEENGRGATDTPPCEQSSPVLH
jgi:hypothetical protein